MASFELEKIQIKRNGDGEVVFDAYVAGKKDGAGLVVVQEWWGVDYEIKNHALALADLGFRTLIPDLYRGKVALEAAEAEHLMEGLDWQGAVEDIAASAQWLKDTGTKKVGVLGFCMGGALAVASAVKVEAISAVVSFYGTPPDVLADATQAKVPVQAHFGELDSFEGFSDVKAAKALGEKLAASGIPHEIHLYPGQGHAFMATSPEAVKRKEGQGFAKHDQEAVELAWSRVGEWLGKFIV
eukprot:TRINITY_DN574_c0_g1_i1.p1 TRINITY_DN574_c0_g1~~TRINITY_DN574_c0_g1_i1.p1  ORF type:complete len:241 (-),score=83.84 TRINITY_DN574_c0_g1_i1:339-1061(-)